MQLYRQLALAALASVAFSEVALAQNIGPSTTTEPYVLPSRAGVSTTSILTTGDAVGGYRMVGIPDGAGAWLENASTVAFVANHELGANAGVTRAHGSRGAFVSRWQIDKTTLRVLSGRDHLVGATSVNLWNGSGYTAGTTAFDRFCSGDLPSQSGMSFRAGSGIYGTTERIYLSGEETSPPFANDHGRLFAHVLTGPNANKSFQLPRLGRAAIENALTSPYAQPKTVVVIMDDGNREVNVTTNICTTSGQTGCSEPPSEMRIYVGTKQRSGTEIEKAGLTNGNLFGLRVRASNGTVVASENASFVFSSAAPAVNTASFELVNFGDVSAKTGNQQQLDQVANQITQWIRIEDGAWDPRPGKQNDFYFVTTGRITSSASTWRPSRLWRLRFNDITAPESGGTVEMLLQNAFYSGAGTTPDADPGYQMFDNMTIDSLGRIILQEDVGGNDRLGRIWLYGIDTKQLVEVARFNEKFFKPGAPGFLTNDEESSGVLDAGSMLGKGWFLLTAQSHRASADTELAEGGQFVAMYIDPNIGAPGFTAPIVLPGQPSPLPAPNGGK